MKIHLNFESELENNVLDQIKFIKSDFNLLFGNKTVFSKKDKDIALGILNHLSKSIDSPVGIRYLSETLESLEEEYPTLF